MEEKADFPDKMLRWCAGFMALVFAALSEYALCAAIRLLYHPVLPKLSDFEAIFVVPASAFMPEPVERLQYVCAVLALPFALYGWYLFFRRIITRGEAALRDFSARLAWAALVIGAAWVLALAITSPYAFYNNILVSTLWFGPASGSVFYGLLNPLTGLVLGVAAVVYFYRHDAVFEKRAARLAAYAAFGLILTSLPALEIFGPQMLDNSSHYGMHFEAAFHAVCAVYSGKKLLADFVSQYGLYPVFLNFIFKLAGLSVLKFTALMALLSIAAYLAVFAALRLLLDSKTIAAMTACAVAYFTQLHFTLYSTEHYFQGVPLRFLMPALAVSLAFLYFFRKSRAAYYGCGLLSAAAVLWNFDTGFVVLASWSLALIYSEALERGCRRAVAPALAHLALNAAFLTAFLAVFSTYTKIAAGRWPDFAGFFAYLGYFYGYGFNMYPMKLFHTWNIVALIYAAGLLYAAQKLHAGEAGPRAKAVFFLSVLGCGLFAYFQGRSFTPNLLFVAWPSVMIAALGFERLLAFGRGHGEAVHARIAAAIAAVALASCAVSALQIVPFAAHQAARRALPALRGTASAATAKMDFIKENTKPGDTVLILSYNRGPFHVYAGTKDPLTLPGLAELYLTGEIDEIARMAESRQYPVFVDNGVFKNHTVYTAKIFRAVEDNYGISVESPAGLSLWLPKRDAAVSGRRFIWPQASLLLSGVHTARSVAAPGLRLKLRPSDRTLFMQNSAGAGKP